jgi:hypothetical protein
MRRILLGGLGLALGAFAPPALAQQPTRAAPAPPRAAALGRPSAIPDPQPEPEITQTGLLRNGPARPTVAYAPGGQFGTPTPTVAAPAVTPGVPVSAAPTYAAPTYGAPTYGVPAYGAPTYGAPAYGAPVAGVPVAAPGGQLPATPIGPPRVVPTPPSVTESRGDPTGRIPVGPAPDVTYVPSVLPGGGFDCPPGLEEPMFIGDTPVTGTERVARIGKGWVSAELLLWWSRGQSVPPLITTGGAGFGILGRPDTRVLLGGSFGETFHTGGRVGGGYWFGDGECRGVDARLFWVSPTTASFGASTNQFPLLARPFENVNPGITTPNVGPGQSAEIVARPGVATGSVVATLKSTVWGAGSELPAAPGRRPELQARRAGRLPVPRRARAAGHHRAVRPHPGLGPDGRRAGGVRGRSPTRSARPTGSTAGRSGSPAPTAAGGGRSTRGRRSRSARSARRPRSSARSR